MATKKDIAVAAMSRRLGKQGTLNVVEQTQASEERKESYLIQVRLANIKLKNKIGKFEATLREKEELAEGLHLIDFEQLKIENQTYNEKIEERNEELLKLRKKITSTVQVLTHVKEKLQFVQVENEQKAAQIMYVEALDAHKRDILTKTKQARDGLHMDNLKLRQRCRLLGKDDLLRDFEDKVDTSEARNVDAEMQWCKEKNRASQTFTAVYLRYRHSLTFTFPPKFHKSWHLGTWHCNFLFTNPLNSMFFLFLFV
ncbi:coiled-coil domain-containing protein 96-like [Acipenser ruthenus]|uniref:coiled-coil domain-containing protein 96-like n=1 Tax=Acipenser ruthenus TaxID=7906 RepID=UPI002742273D|nr:coiled-coil domain-containing protein 96-like [Acipenser ruthenus]